MRFLTYRVKYNFDVAGMSSYASVSHRFRDLKKYLAVTPLLNSVCEDITIRMS